MNVEEWREDAILTEAFLHPKLLFQEHTYAQDNGHFVVTPYPRLQSLSGHKVILIRRVFDKRKIAWLLVLMLIISPASGTIVGIYSHRADVGVALSAGIFALASFLQGLFAWLQL